MDIAISNVRYMQHEEFSTFFSKSNQFLGEKGNLFCFLSYANIKSRKSNVVVKP